MSAPKLFTFEVENGRTGERMKFIGQGHGMMEALQDALKGADQQFRPKNDGKQRPALGVMAKTLTGKFVNRSLKEFEGDVAYGQPQPMPEEF